MAICVSSLSPIMSFYCLSYLMVHLLVVGANFNIHYQERDRSFAKSDAAWLASLIMMPEVQLLGQVVCLDRVLTSRGMPRITLENQLTLLHEEPFRLNGSPQSKKFLVLRVSMLQNKRK